MFTKTLYLNMSLACEGIKKNLAELPNPVEYEVVHSLYREKVQEDGGTWENIGSILLDFLRDLDAQEGLMVFCANETCCWWDWEKSEHNKYPSCYTGMNATYDVNEVFVEAGEGVFVYHNVDAVSENSFPIIVVKKSFADALGNEVERWLSEKKSPENDFTAKISPALYVELFNVG